MNVDIHTEQVVMRPEWQHMIDDCVARCVRHYPDLVAIDVRLRHGHPGCCVDGAVDVRATASGRSLRAARQADFMTTALHGAFEALEYELLVHEAVQRTA